MQQTSGRPPHGGRGLKSKGLRCQISGLRSPPTRGAWVEIYYPLLTWWDPARRPPHGGRGLKSLWTVWPLAVYRVAPHTGGVG